MEDDLGRSSRCRLEQVDRLDKEVVEVDARGAIIDPTSHRGSVLCIVAHHLVVDAVSWSILIEDLTAAYGMALSGASVTLPSRTTSFPAWTEHHLRASTNAGLSRWCSQLPAGQQTPEPGLEADRRCVIGQLDRETTTHLLTDANDAYSTRPEELILTALAAVLADEAGTLHLMLEGHGRVPAEGLDVSRTVGWFTVQYPLALNRGPDRVSDLKRTKEVLRAAAKDAMDYAVQRYVRRRPELTTLNEPSLLFNYLGRSDVESGGLLVPLPSPDASSRHPDNRMTHELELVAFIDEAGLTVRWYHADPLRDAQIQRLADAHMSELRSLIDHSLGAEAGGFTPSDFPAADLGQDELDDFLDGLT